MKKNHAGRARVLCASGFDRAFVSWFVMRRLQQMGVSFTIFITTLFFGQTIQFDLRDEFQECSAVAGCIAYVQGPGPALLLGA